MFILAAQDVQAKGVLNGWKESCIYIWGGGGGYLSIEHKAPQDPDATSLVAYVSLYLFWELTPRLCIFDEHVNMKLL